MIIRGLTLHQPWAYAIARLGKNIENRSWDPPGSMKGQLIAIHAGKGVDLSGLAQLEGEGLEVPQPFQQSCIVAVAQLVDVIHGRSGEWNMWYCGEGPGWVLENVVALKKPIYCGGKQGLWEVDRLRFGYFE